MWSIMKKKGIFSQNIAIKKEVQKEWFLVVRNAHRIVPYKVYVFFCWSEVNKRNKSVKYGVFMYICPSFQVEEGVAFG
jgi:hypothetical protein